MIFPLTYKRSILSLFRHRQFLSREINFGHTCHKRVSVLKVCVKICLVEYLCLFFGFFCKYSETKKRVSPIETEYLIDKWTRLSVNVWTLWIWWKENLSVWVFEGGSHDPKVLKKKKSNSDWTPIVCSREEKELWYLVWKAPPRPPHCGEHLRGTPER